MKRVVSEELVREGTTPQPARTVPGIHSAGAPNYRAGWPSLLMYGLAAGTIAAGAAHLLGNLNLAFAGRRTYIGTGLQIFGVVLIVGTASAFGDRVVVGVRRRAHGVFRRHFRR